MLPPPLGPAAARRLLALGRPGLLARRVRLAPAAAPAAASVWRTAAFVAARTAATSSRSRSRPKAAAARKKMPTRRASAAKSRPKSRSKSATRARRPAAKKKAASKRKKATTSSRPGRKRPVGRPRKPLTPEQTRRKRIAALRASVLSKPAALPQTAWTVFTSEYYKRAGAGTRVTKDTMTAVSREYKALPSSEMGRLESAAAHNKTANATAYRNWVAKLSPAEIRSANLARASLRRLGSSSRASRHPIKDARQPKRPTSAYLQFFKSRYGELAQDGSTIPVVAKRVAAEWKTLDAEALKPYARLAQADLARYRKEMKDTFGITVRS